MANTQQPFPYKNITALPKPPYVRRYITPMTFNRYVFEYQPIQERVEWETAIQEATDWLTSTNGSGYLHWIDDKKYPINRQGIMIDYSAGYGL